MGINKDKLIDAMHLSLLNLVDRYYTARLKEGDQFQDWGKFYMLQNFDKGIVPFEVIGGQFLFFVPEDDRQYLSAHREEYATIFIQALSQIDFREREERAKRDYRLEPFHGKLDELIHCLVFTAPNDYFIKLGQKVLGEMDDDECFDGQKLLNLFFELKQCGGKSIKDTLKARVICTLVRDYDIDFINSFSKKDLDFIIDITLVKLDTFLEGYALIK